MLGASRMVAALACVSCQAVTDFDTGFFHEPNERDAGSDGDADTDADVDADADTDAGIDAGLCTVDADRDGTCAPYDCDDLNPRRSPFEPEFCPDRTDNDCDDLVDFEDACDTLNDDCAGPVVVLSQDPDVDPSFWAFELPLAELYRDDLSVGVVPAGSDCFEGAGAGAGDAVFQLAAVTDCIVSVDATSPDGGSPIVVVESACEDGQVPEVCDLGLGKPASVTTTLGAGERAWLIIDDAGLFGVGTAHVEIRITRP